MAREFLFFMSAKLCINYWSVKSVYVQVIFFTASHICELRRAHASPFPFLSQEGGRSYRRQLCWICSPRWFRNWGWFLRWGAGTDCEPVTLTWTATWGLCFLSLCEFLYLIVTCMQFTQEKIFKHQMLRLS